jgi:hypothetical protein
MAGINYFPLIFMGTLGILIIIFKRPVAKFLIGARNIWKSNSIAQKVPFAVFAKEYDEDPTADRAMIILGIFFIFMGSLLTLFPNIVGN